VDANDEAPSQMIIGAEPRDRILFATRVEWTAIDTAIQGFVTAGEPLTHFYVVLPEVGACSGMPLVRKLLALSRSGARATGNKE
jgi:hypothetical protein